MKIQYHPGKALAAQIDLYTTDEQPASAVARTFAERYLAILEKCVPYLELDEWALLHAVHKEMTHPDPELLIATAVRQVIEHQASLDDSKGFLCRVSGLGPANRWAILNQIERQR